MKRVGLSVVALVCVLLIGGCTANTDSAQMGASNGSIAKPTDEQFERWAMPSDQYVLSMAEMEVLIARVRYELRDCVQAAGFPNYDAGYSFSESSVNTDEYAVSGMRINNAENLGKYGYELPPSFNGGQNPQKLSPTAAEQSAEQNCLAQPNTDEQATTEEGTAEDLNNQMNARLMGVMDEAMQDQTVVAAAVAWRECMAPLGIADLPDSPEDMPSKSLKNRWGRANMDGDEHPANADELAVAAQDGQCRQSSGYDRAYYDASWAIESKLLADRPDIVDEGVRARAVYDEELKAAREFIAAHGGK
jgi:hypothetical protein